MQLRTINNAFSVRKLPVELVIDRVKAYCYMIYDDGKNYDTYSVMVPRINDLSLANWIEHAEYFNRAMNKNSD